MVVAATRSAGTACAGRGGGGRRGGGGGGRGGGGGGDVRVAEVRQRHHAPVSAAGSLGDDLGRPELRGVRALAGLLGPALGGIRQRQGERPAAVGDHRGAHRVPGLDGVVVEHRGGGEHLEPALVGGGAAVAVG